MLLIYAVIAIFNANKTNHELYWTSCFVRLKLRLTFLVNFRKKEDNAKMQRNICRFVGCIIEVIDARVNSN